MKLSKPRHYINLPPVMNDTVFLRRRIGLTNRLLYGLYTVWEGNYNL